MKKEDFYWTVGFLEGEGSFYINKNKRGITAVVNATQADPECLSRLHSLYGGSMNCNDRKSDLRAGVNRRPLHEWRLTGIRAASLMRQLKPFMSARRQAQITASLAGFEDYRSSKGLPLYEDARATRYIRARSQGPA